MSITAFRLSSGLLSLPHNRTPGVRSGIRDSCKVAFHINGLGDSLTLLEVYTCAIN